MRSSFLGLIVTAALTIASIGGSSSVNAQISDGAVRTDARGNVARWDPCAPMYWKLASNYPNNFFVKITRRAIEQLNRATGLNFQFMGVIPVDDPGKFQRNTLVISAVPPSPGQMVAGTTRLRFTDGVDDSLVIDSATVAINSRITKGQLRSMLLPVMLHELGHVIGVAHVNDVDNIMYPYARTTTKYSSNDVAEFAPFGSSLGCHPVKVLTNL